MEIYRTNEGPQSAENNQILGERWDECLTRILDELQEFELFRVRNSDPKSSLLDDVAGIIGRAGLSDGARVSLIAELLTDNGYPLEGPGD